MSCLCRKKIDKEFIDAIVSVDYFKEIANSYVETESITDEKGTYERLKITKKEDMDKFWGVFSIEGGKKDNMEYIVTVLKHIVYHLEQEYTPNNDIYLGFITLYDKVNNYRNKIQNVHEKIISIRKIQLEIKEKLQKFESNLIRKRMI